MLEFVVKIDGLSEATKAILDLPGIYRRARRSALSALGYFFRNEMATEMMRAVNGGYLNWPGLNPHTGILSQARDKRTGGRQWITRYRALKGKQMSIGKRRRQARKFLGFSAPSITSGRVEPLSRMKGDIDYTVDSEDLYVATGFINDHSKLIRLVRKQAEGYEVPVTKKMRRMAFALGFPLRKSTRALKTPSRQLVRPIRDRYISKVPAMFDYMIHLSLERYRSRGRKVHDPLAMFRKG